MSSDDVPSPPQQKPSTSSFADVIKHLAVGLARPQSPAPSTGSSDQGLSNPLEGRRGSRVVFGFESMHRGSVVSNSSDAAGAPDFEGSLRGLSQPQNPNQAIEEAETLSRSLQWYNAEQSIALWEAGAWLLHHESSEARQNGARLLEAVALRHDLSVVQRRLIFEAVAQPSESDVIAARVKSLIVLSDHGRRSDITQTSLLSIVLSCLLPFYEAISAARSKARKGKLAKPNLLYHDEAVFADLFQFAVDLITLQRSPPSSEEIEALLDQVCTICKKTSVAADIKNSLGVFDAIILYTEVPEASFGPLLEVLCSIHASVKPLSGPTSRAVRNLAKSRRQAEMVDIVHKFLMESSDERVRNLNVVRGAIKVFVDLIRAHRQEGMPDLAFDRLLTSLRTVADKDDGRIDADVLELCLNILEADYVTSALEQDWSRMIDLLTLCSRRAIEDSSDSSPLDETKSNILASVAQIAVALEALWERLNRDQKLAAGRYLLTICQHIEASQADLILNLMRTEKFCYPEHPEWEANCVQLIRCFLRPRTRTTDIRILALETLKEPFSSDDFLGLFQEKGLLDIILGDFSEESDLLFLESLVTFIVEVAVLAKDFDTFQRLVDVLSSSMRADLKRQEPHATATVSSSTAHSRRRSSHSVLELSLANVCSIGLVKIFLRSLNTSAKKVVLVYETLLNLAAHQDRPTDSRLTVLKLLFRLRCDSSGSIIVDSTAENDFLTSVLGGSSEVGSKFHTTADEHSDGPVAGSDNGQGPQSIRSTQRDTLTSHLSRPLGRSGSSYNRPAKLTPPVWTYASPQVLPEVPPSSSSPYVFAYAAPSAEVPDDAESGLKETLKINMWLETIISLLQREVDWDIYSYILAHLAAQLSNRDFFHNAIPQIKFLRSVLCDQVKNETFREPPGWTGVKKTDVAVCVFECLAMLVSYHDHFAKSEEDELVRSFMLGIIGSWGGTSRGSIHALSVCCHEIPLSVTKSLNGILDKLTKVITMANLAVHILEFLALLARLPDVYINLREEELRAVFGICMRVLQTSREQRYKSPDAQSSRSSQGSTRLSGGVREIAATQADPAAADMPPQDSFSRYVYTLTHHVMVFWFLSLKLQDRAKHVNWITSRLISKDDSGKETVEEQTQVFIDLMQRVTFSDLGDTIPFETFPPSPADGPVTKKSWIVGMSIVTVETAGVSGLTQLTKRQASGTTYAVYQQRTAPVLAHQVPSAADAHVHSDSMRTAILPSHVMLQLTTTAFPTPTVTQPIPLPDDDITRRALSTFDRNDIVDGHKLGVIYVGDGQTTEAEILANTAGSADYDYFVSGLGTKVQLRDAQFNTQGLHPDTDGAHTYAWRDRVSEIVYHVATMMPTDPDGDPNCVNKKRHIGNDFVNIIFNRSNLPYNFDTIPSQFNFVNIVISPASRVAAADKAAEACSLAESGTAAFEKQCYQVRVMSKPGFPEISPAATPKVISGKNLAAFVRILALNASVFSLVWNSPGGEHVSSWRNRLREIKRLRERALLVQSQAPDASEATYPGYRRNTKAAIHSEELPSRAGNVRTDFSTDWNAAAETNVLQNLDFSRWAR